MERIFQALMFVDLYGMAPWCMRIITGSEIGSLENVYSFELCYSVPFIQRMIIHKWNSEP